MKCKKSFSIKQPKVIANTIDTKGLFCFESSNIPEVLKRFIGNPSVNNKIFGNGCHFDCSILQENHRVLFGDGNLWHYTAPNNVRTLRLLMSESDELFMKDEIQPHLDRFVETVNAMEVMDELCLHNPLYDAAKEALYISFMMNFLKEI